MREQLQIFLSSISQSARQLPIESFQKPSFEHEEIETKLRTAIPLATEPLYKIQFKESEQNELKPRGRQFPLYYKFWERLLAVGKIKSSIHEKVKPRHNDGICVKNVRGLKFHYVVNQYNGRVEFYIDRGDAPLNKKTFDELIQHRREIDAAFGDSLSWERLDNRKTSRLGYYFNGGVKNNESDWQAIHSKMIDAMIRLEKAVSPFIPQLLGQSSFRQNNFVENRNPTSKEKIEIDERTVKQKTKK